MLLCFKLNMSQVRRDYGKAEVRTVICNKSLEVEISLKDECRSRIAC